MNWKKAVIMLLVYIGLEALFWFSWTSYNGNWHPQVLNLVMSFLVGTWIGELSKKSR